MADIAYAEWLQQPERVVVITDATLSARWGALARTEQLSSGLAGEAAASTEAQRQIAFRGDPMVEEQLKIAELFDVSAIKGSVRTVTIAGDPIYGAGKDVFVIGGDPDHATGITLLSVLRKL